MHKTFNTNYDAAFEACRNALKALDIEINTSSKSKGVIHASTSTSFLSWGEAIKISVNEIGPSKTKVTVSSDAQAQLISWGKNDRNKEEIMSKISKYVNK